jgi:hypothetical protein
VKAADAAWERHRNEFLQRRNYWVRVGVDEEIAEEKRPRGPGRTPRKRNNSTVDLRYEWAALRLCGIGCKEISARYNLKESQVTKKSKEILEAAGWNRTSWLAHRKPCNLPLDCGETVGVDFIFHRPDGSAWGDLADSMDRLFADAGLNSIATKRRNRITLHSLRHTFASWLAIAGVSLRRIQELLGHKSIVTTERYSHLGANG